MGIRISILFFLFFISANISAQIYKTQPVLSEIYTIQLNLNGDWTKSPVMILNQGDYIQLSFDRISDDSFNRLRYKILHCNADWTVSSLSEIEYLDGFNDNPVEDYAASVNTTIEYTNFRIVFPNDYLQFKIAGNYVVIVYEEDNPDKILLNACFSIIDPQIKISGSMTSNTLIDSNRGHQQISFTIDHSSINLRDVFSDLKVFVRQNDRLDNQKVNVKPTYVQPNKLVYEQNRELIFEAGNEYRRFESVSYKYNGLHVESTEYRRPYYYTTIIPDKIRAGRQYIYDQDQNGKFLIRNAEGNDPDLDADYFFVKFTLLAETPFANNLYLNGGFTDNTFDGDYQMQYDFVNKEYTTTVLMKQGAYNYQYLLEKDGAYSTSATEGNYYETENEYSVYVYYRPIGQRSDVLIGYLNISKNSLK